MTTLTSLVEDPRFQKLTQEDKEASLNLFYDDEVAAGRSSEMDRIKTQNGMRLKHSYDTETERRKPFVEGRHKALTDFAAASHGKSKAETAVLYQRFLAASGVFERQEAKENKNMKEERDLALQIYEGDPDEVNKSQGERGWFKGHVMGTIGEGIEAAAAVVDNFKPTDLLMGAGVAIGRTDQPSVIRENKANEARAALKERGYSDADASKLVNNLREDLKPFSDDFKSEPMRTNSFGEVVFNPEFLARTNPEEVTKTLREMDIPERAKERALLRLEDEQHSAMLEMSAIATHGSIEERLGSDSTWFEKTDDYLNSQADRNWADKFARSSYHKLSASAVGFIGGTGAFAGANAIGDGNFSKIMENATTDSSQMSEQLKEGMLGSFGTDMVALIPDLLVAKGGGMLAASFNKLNRGRKLAAAGGALLRPDAAKLVAFEQQIAKGSVSLAAGYSAGARTMNSAMAQGMEYSDAAMMAFRQTVITGAVTRIGSGSGAEPWTTGLKQESKKFWKDFIVKDVIGEGVEEAIDELISGIAVEMKMDPSASIADAVDGALHAFLLGSAMGGGMNVKALVKPTSTPGDPTPNLDDAVQLSTSNLDMTDAYGGSLPVAEAASLTPNLDEETGAEGTTGEEGAKGVSQATREDSVDIGEGVIIDTSESAKPVAEQVFENGIGDHQVVTAKIDAKDLKVKTGKDGKARVHVGGVPSDRIFDGRTGKFETEVNSKAPQKSNSFLGSKSLHSKANAKDSKSEKAETPAVAARLTTSAPDTEAASKRAKILPNGGSADLAALDSKETPVEFKKAPKGGIFNKETGAVEIDPDSGSPESIRSRVLPRVAAERAAITSGNTFSDVTEALNTDLVDAHAEGRSDLNDDDKAKLFIASALTGTAKEIKTATDELARLVKEGDPKVISQIRILLEDIESGQMGKASKEILKGRIEGLRQKFNRAEVKPTVSKDGKETKPGSPDVNLGAPHDTVRIPTERAGITQTDVATFTALRQDNGKNNNVAEVDSGDSGDTNKITKNLSLGSVIEVAMQNGETDRWVVMNHHVRPDGNVRHELRRISKDSEIAKSEFDKIYKSPKTREAIVSAFKIVTATGVSRSDQIKVIQKTASELLEKIAGKIFTEDKLKFVSGSDETMKGRLAATQAKQDENGDTQDPNIYINEDALLEYFKNIQGFGNTDNEAGQKMKADDLAMHLNQILFEEVAHYQALRAIKPEEVISMMGEWINVAKEDVPARAELLRWYGYQQNNLNPSPSEKAQMWSDVEALLEDGNESEFDKFAFSVGHEALAGFVQLLRTGNTTANIGGDVNAWLSQWAKLSPAKPEASEESPKPAPRRFGKRSGGSYVAPANAAPLEGKEAEKEAKNTDAPALFKRLTEMAGRMVRAVRNYFHAHRKLNSLPESLSSLVDRLDKVIRDEANSITPPNPFKVEAKALSQASNEVNQIRSLVAGNFDLVEVQKNLQASLKRVSQATGADTPSIINLGWNTDGTASLKLNPEMESVIEQTELDILNDSTAAINASGRPTIVANNAASNANVQLVLRQLNIAEDSLIGNTPKEKAALIAKAEAYASERISQGLMGASGKPISVSTDNMIKTLSDEYAAWNLENRASIMSDKLRDAAPTSFEGYQDSPDSIAAIRKYKQLEALAIKEASLLDGLTDDMDNVNQAVKNFNEFNDHLLNDTKAELYNSAFAVALREERAERLKTAQDYADIIEATPLKTFRSVSQFLSVFKAEQLLNTKKTGTGRFEAAMASETFSKAYPDMDPKKAIEVFEEAHAIVETVSGLQNSAAEMQFALIGGRPPARVARDSAGTNVEGLRSINMTARSNTNNSVTFSLSKILRTAGPSVKTTTESGLAISPKEIHKQELKGRFGANTDKVQKQKAENLERLHEITKGGLGTAPMTPEDIGEVIYLKTELAKDFNIGLSYTAQGKEVGIKFLEDISPALSESLKTSSGLDTAAAELVRSTQAAYNLVGLDIHNLSLDRAAVPSNKVKSLMRSNAIAQARHITTESIYRDFMGDLTLLNTDFLATGGFPIRYEEVSKGTTPEGDAIRGETPVFSDTWFDVPQVPAGFVDEELGFDTNNSLKVLADSGMLAEMLTEVSRALDTMENPSTLPLSEPVLTHQHGLTPAGLVYQMTAAPFTALLARIKNQQITVAGKNHLNEKASYVDYIIKNLPADSKVTAERVSELFDSLPPGLENASSWDNSADTTSTFNAFVDFNRQIAAANLAYTESVKSLRTSRTVREIQNRTSVSPDLDGGDLELAVNPSIMRNMAEDGRRKRDERLANDNGAFKDILSAIRPDKAHKVLNRYISAMQEVDPMVFKTPSWDTSPDSVNGEQFAMRHLDNRGETRNSETGDTFDTSRAGGAVRSELQKQQDAVNHLADIRTVALMELYGRNETLISRILASPEYSSSHKDAEGNIVIKYDYAKIDQDIMDELSRLTQDERDAGHIFDGNADTDESRLVVDHHLRDLFRAQGGNPDAKFEDSNFENMSPEAIAIQSVLYNGGQVHRTMDKDTLVVEGTREANTVSQSTEWQVLTHLMGNIPGLSFVRGNAGHESSDTTPALVFVESDTTPVVIAPMQNLGMIGTKDMEETMKALIKHAAKNNGADLEGIANGILQPIKELYDGSSRGRVTDSVFETVKAFAARPSDSEDGGLGRVLTEQEEAKLHASVSGLQDFTSFLATKVSESARESVFLAHHAEGNIANMNPELAVETIVQFMVSEPLKRLLALSSVGLNVSTDPNNYTWAKLGDIMRGDMLVTEDGSTMASFVKDLANDIPEVQEVEDEPAEVSPEELLGAMSDNFTNGLKEERAIIEAGEAVNNRLIGPTRPKVSFSTVAAGTLGFTDGQNQANKILINSLVEIAKAPAKEAPGLIPERREGGLSEFDARQIMALFTDEQLAEIDPNISEYAVLAGTSYNIPDLMKLPAASAQAILSKYTGIVQEREGQNYSITGRWGYESGLDHVGGRSHYSAHMLANQIDSGRYSVAEKLGLINSGDEKVLKAMNPEKLREMLLSKGLATSKDNPKADRNLPLSEREIDIIDTIVADMKQVEDLYADVMNSTKLKVMESTRAMELLTGVLENIEQIEQELILAPDANAFMGMVSQGTDWNILNNNANAQAAMKRVVDNFFASEDDLADQIADRLLAIEEDANLTAEGFEVGRIALQDLINAQDTPYYKQTKQAVLKRIGSFTEQHKKTPESYVSMMEANLARVDAAEEAGDTKEARRLKRIFITQSTNLDDWVQKTTAYVDSEFGKGALSRSSGLRNKPMVSFSRWSGDVGEFDSIRNDLQSGNMMKKVRQFKTTAFSLTHPEGLLSRIQDITLSESLRAFTKAPADAPRSDIGDIQGSISNLVPSEALSQTSAKMGLDLSGLDVKKILSEAEGTPKKRAQAISNIIKKHLGLDFHPAFRNMKQGLESEIDAIPKAFVGNDGQVADLREFIDGLSFTGLSSTEAKKVGISVMRKAIEGQIDINSATLVAITRDQASRVKRSRNYSPGASTFRDGRHAGFRIDGNAADTELTYRVLTELAKTHSDYYNNSRREIEGKTGLALVQAATESADAKLESMEAARQALTQATGTQYSIVGSMLAPVDHRARIADILARNGQTPSEGDIDASVASLALFASVGYMDDQTDFGRRPSKIGGAPVPPIPSGLTPAQRKAREKKDANSHYQFHKRNGKTAIARMISDGAMIYGEADDSGAIKAHGEEIFKADLIGEVKELHESMFSYVSLFKDYLDSVEDDFMGTNLDVIKKVNALRVRVADFTKKTGSDQAVDHERAMAEYNVKKKADPTLAPPAAPVYDTISRSTSAQLLSIYVDAKALKVAQDNSTALEAGFVDAKLLKSTSAWNPNRIFEAMSHHDAKIRHLFARTIEGQNIAQGVSGILEYGFATGGGVSHGRAGYLSMKESVNAFLGRSVPKRKKIGKGSAKKGQAVGLNEEVDMERSSEAFFLQSMLSKLTTENAPTAANEILVAMEANKNSLETIAARNKVATGFGAKVAIKSAASSVNDKLFHTNTKLLEDRKVYEDLYNKYKPHLEAIAANGGSGATDLVFAMTQAADADTRAYSEALNKTFKYYRSLYQAQSQLVPKSELNDPDNPSPWASGRGNEYLLTRPAVPFRWQKAYTSDARLEGEEYNMSDTVSMRGTTWLRSLRSGTNPGDLQILDINGLRGPSAILDDMAFRMNVSPAFELVQAITGVSRSVIQGGVARGSLEFESEDLEGSIFGYAKGRTHVPSHGNGRSEQGRLKDIALGLSHIIQEVVANDVAREAPNSYVQDRIEEVQAIGMGSALISGSQLIRQTVPGLIGYTTTYGGNKNVWGLWIKQAIGMMSSSLPFYKGGNHYQDYVGKVEAFIKEHSYPLYLRNAEGIELFMNAAQSATPRLTNRNTLSKKGSPLHKFEKNVVNGLKGLAKGVKDGAVSGVQFGLKNTIAAAEKSAIQAIFMSEVADRVSKMTGRDITPEHLINDIGGDFHQFLNAGLLEQARIAAVDILGQSDTSKKARIFQRSDSATGEVVRTMFTTFATHLMSTAANSMAGARMAYHGETKADRKAGRRLFATNAAQNSIYQVMNFNFLSWLASNALVPLMGWDDEERKKKLLEFYDLDEGADERFGLNPMGYLTQFGLGTQRPFGYDYYQGEWSDKRLDKDFQNLGIKVTMEFLNQVPGYGMAISTPVGGAVVKDGIIDPLATSMTGISTSVGQRRGASFGAPGKDGQQSDSAINRAIYQASMTYRNQLADRNYLAMGLNFLAQPIYHTTNSTQAEVAPEAWKYLLGGMIPAQPRESNRLMWEKFDKASDSQLWHDKNQEYKR